MIGLSERIKRLQELRFAISDSLHEVVVHELHFGAKLFQVCLIGGVKLL